MRVPPMKWLRRLPGLESESFESDGFCEEVSFRVSIDSILL